MDAMDVLARYPDANALGEFRFAHRVGSRQYKDQQVFIAIVVSVLLALGIVVPLLARDTTGLILGATFVGLAVLCVWRAIYLRRENNAKLLVVFDEGLLCVDKTGHTTCRWDEIESVDEAHLRLRTDAYVQQIDYMVIH